METTKMCLFAVSVLLSLLWNVASTSILKADVNSTKCIVKINDRTSLKSVGDRWITNDTCIWHECIINGSGSPYENLVKEICTTTQCKEGFVLQEQPGKCCSKCVQNKCKYADKMYNIGDRWRAKNRCFECSKFNYTARISKYKEQCPKVANCLEEHLYEEDCCMKCRSELTKEDKESYLIKEKSHNYNPCKRECIAGKDPEICHYTFVVEWYETLSKACYSCPYNKFDCDRPHCIVADGARRSVSVVNRMMPGPAIEVCLNDTVVVDVKNNLLGGSITIHWHGLHQKATPYMDGVPHISQCPIQPHTTFRYNFIADHAGTHFWYSHTGMQRGDGSFGALIIREPLDRHSKLYDFDLSEHVIIIQDWTHQTGLSMFASHHHSIGDDKPSNVLINGKGRYYRAFEKKLDESQTKLKSTVRTHDKVLIIEKNPSSYITDVKTDNKINEPTIMEVASNIPEMESPSQKDQPHIPKMNERNIKDEMNSKEPHNKTEEDQAHLGEVQQNVSTPQKPKGKKFTIAQPIQDKKEVKNKIYKNSTEQLSIPYEGLFPLETFRVTKGYKYRFRVINAQSLNCPLSLSIDDHNLMVINSDGYDLERVQVSSLVTYAGERFDFILEANQEVDNYWIRFKGLMDCDERFTSTHQAAILHYTGAPHSEPKGMPIYDFERSGVQINPLNKDPGYSDSITITDLNASDPDVAWMHKDPDFKFYIYYDFYAKDNPYYHASNLYGFHQTNNRANRLYTPQLNLINLKFPAFPLLPGRNLINENMFCNESSLAAQGKDCRTEFCECSHVLQVPLNSVVEMILIGVTFDANHPFHLHGNAFRVLAVERIGKSVTVAQVKEMDKNGLLKRKFKNAPIKDTITVLDGGYTIIRFKADNPGYWLFHCHIEFHTEIGMALVLKVGDHSDMLTVPENFPTCSDYVPEIRNRDSSKTTVTTLSSVGIITTIIIIIYYWRISHKITKIINIFRSCLPI